MVTIKHCSHNFVLGSGFVLRSVTIRVHFYSSNRVCVQKKTKFVYKKYTWVLATSNGVCSGPGSSLLIVSQLESLRLNMGIKRIIFSVKIFK